SPLDAWQAGASESPSRQSLEQSVAGAGVAVVGHGRGGAEGEVGRGGPALEPVMAGAVENIAQPNAGRRGRHFGRDELGAIIHECIGEQVFILAAIAKV